MSFLFFYKKGDKIIVHNIKDKAPNGYELIATVDAELMARYLLNHNCTIREYLEAI